MAQTSQKTTVIIKNIHPRAVPTAHGSSVADDLQAYLEGDALTRAFILHKLHKLRKLRKLRKLHKLRKLREQTTSDRTCEYMEYPFRILVWIFLLPVYLLIRPLVLWAGIPEIRSRIDSGAMNDEM